MFNFKTDFMTFWRDQTISLTSFQMLTTQKNLQNSLPNNWYLDQNHAQKNSKTLYTIQYILINDMQVNIDRSL